MGSRRPQRNNPAPAPTIRGANWYLIAAVITVGTLTIIALLLFGRSNPEDERVNVQSLLSYCEAELNACISTGSSEASVTLITLDDVACTACGDFYETTLPQIEAAYVATGQVKVVSIPYARQNAQRVDMIAAYCAGAQGKYSEFRAALIDRPADSTNSTRVAQIQMAERVGIDIGLFSICVDQKQYLQQVDNNVAIIAETGIESLPTFFIDERQLEGAQTFESLASEIEAQLGN